MGRRGTVRSKKKSGKKKGDEGGPEGRDQDASDNELRGTRPGSRAETAQQVLKGSRRRKMKEGKSKSRILQKKQDNVNQIVHSHLNNKKNQSRTLGRRHRRSSLTSIREGTSGGGCVGDLTADARRMGALAQKSGGG